MKQKTKNLLTYIIFAFVALGTFLSVTFQLANPAIYTDMMMNYYMIPMVRNHIETDGTCASLAFTIVDVDTIQCKKILLIV